MNKIQSEIYAKCVGTREYVGTGNYTPTEEEFNLAFPQGEQDIETFLQECSQQPEGINLKRRERTFQVSN